MHTCRAASDDPQDLEGHNIFGNSDDCGDAGSTKLPVNTRVKITEAIIVDDDLCSRETVCFSYSILILSYKRYRYTYVQTCLLKVRLRKYV